MNQNKTPNEDHKVLRVGMIGLGMIFDETYKPVFLGLANSPLYSLPLALSMYAGPQHQPELELEAKTTSIN